MTTPEQAREAFRNIALRYYVEKAHSMCHCIGCGNSVSVSSSQAIEHDPECDVTIVAKFLASLSPPSTASEVPREPMTTPELLSEEDLNRIRISPGWDAVEKLSGHIAVREAQLKAAWAREQDWQRRVNQLHELAALSPPSTASEVPALSDELKSLLIACDSELSAQGHGRPPSSGEHLLDLSWRLRSVYDTRR